MLNGLYSMTNDNNKSETEIVIIADTITSATSKAVTLLKMYYPLMEWSIFISEESNEAYVNGMETLTFAHKNYKIKKLKEMVMIV